MVFRDRRIILHCYRYLAATRHIRAPWNLRLRFPRWVADVEQAAARLEYQSVL